MKKYLPTIIGLTTLVVGSIATAKASAVLEQLAGRKWL